MFLFDLIGSKQGSSVIQRWIASLVNQNTPTPQAEIKTYPRVTYHGYPSLGLSLEYKQGNIEIPNDGLILDAIHLYNRHKQHGRDATGSYVSFPNLPITLDLSGEEENSSVLKIDVTASMTAKEFVEVLGEPTRKGGGHGPSSGSIDIWCEWTNSGIMVEFGGPEARGPEAWNQGRNAVWKVLTIFKA